MTIPCINCITLAICKQQCRVSFKDDHLRDIKLSTLYEKCPMLHSYLIPPDSPNDDFADMGMDMSRVMKTIDFLKRPHKQ